MLTVNYPQTKEEPWTMQPQRKRLAKTVEVKTILFIYEEDSVSCDLLCRDIELLYIVMG